MTVNSINSVEDYKRTDKEIREAELQHASIHRYFSSYYLVDQQMYMYELNSIAELLSEKVNDPDLIYERKQWFR